MKKLSLSLSLLLVTAVPALAHTGHGVADGFIHGFQHPFFGIDHLLAMFAVGLWSGLVMPKRFWMGALTFMAAMVIGAGLSWAGVGIPMAEAGITLSVIAFGALTALSRQGQNDGITRASLATIALFALFHGHAHAAESTGNVSTYLAGFLIASAALHGLGIGLARAIADRSFIQRALGAGIAASGLYMMVG